MKSLSFAGCKGSEKQAADRGLPGKMDPRGDLGGSLGDCPDPGGPGLEGVRGEDPEQRWGPESQLQGTYANSSHR